MDATQTQVSKRKGTLSLVGAGMSAVAATVCCVGPLLLLAVGVSGAWIGNLTVFQPYRFVFAPLTIAFLGFAFFRVYKKPGKAACACEDKRTQKKRRIILWGATAVILALLAFPTFAPYVFAGNQAQEDVRMERVVLEVRNMTCSACTVTVRKSLARLEGVKEAKVTLRPPEAVVVYDPSKVSTQELIEATTHAGYPSSIRLEQ